MRVLLIHPDCHSGGAEIAGNWPSAWVAWLTAYLEAGGDTDVHFVDAMTHRLDDEQVRARIEALRPDARVHARPGPQAIAAADAGWVTLHGPKIETRRKKGEEIAVAALAAMQASAWALFERAGLEHHVRRPPESMADGAEVKRACRLNTRWRAGSAAHAGHRGLSSMTTTACRSSSSARMRSRIVGTKRRAKDRPTASSKALSAARGDHRPSGASMYLAKASA